MVAQEGVGFGVELEIILEFWPKDLPSFFLLHFIKANLRHCEGPVSIESDIEKSQ